MGEGIKLKGNNMSSLLKVINHCINFLIIYEYDKVNIVLLKYKFQ